MRELYRLVLVDTPLAPYFSECITSEVSSPPEPLRQSLQLNSSERWGNVA